MTRTDPRSALQATGRAAAAAHAVLPAFVLDVVIEDGDWSAAGDVDALAQAAAQAVATHADLGTTRVAATVAFDTDGRMRRLNRAFRGKDAPTNVLSFPAPSQAKAAMAPDEPSYLGDIILAAETVMREAAALAIPAAHHVQHLVVHGLLHLLGHDHETDPDAIRMETLETVILATLGVPDPYAGTEPFVP